MLAIVGGFLCLIASMIIGSTLRMPQHLTGGRTVVGIGFGIVGVALILIWLLS